MRRAIYILAWAPYLVREQGHAVPGLGTGLQTTLGVALGRSQAGKLGAGTALGFSGSRSRPPPPCMCLALPCTRILGGPWAQSLLSIQPEAPFPRLSVPPGLCLHSRGFTPGLLLSFPTPAVRAEQSRGPAGLLESREAERKGLDGCGKRQNSSLGSSSQGRKSSQIPGPAYNRCLQTPGLASISATSW